MNPFNLKGHLPMKKMIVLGAMALLSCAPKTQTFATGGSRADATVGVQHGPAEQPPAASVVSGMQSIAEQKCGVWGYESAEPFGGFKRNCVAPSDYGCFLWDFTFEFQCTGAPSQQAPKV